MKMRQIHPEHHGDLLAYLYYVELEVTWNTAEAQNNELDQQLLKKSTVTKTCDAETMVIMHLTQVLCTFIHLSIKIRVTNHIRHFI